MMQPQLWEEDFKPHRLGGLALVSSRKESWKSKQEALLYFQNQHEWRTWNPLILRLHAVCFFYLCQSYRALNPFQEHGLYELGDGTVALKCHKQIEKEAYVNMDPHVDAFKCLGKVCHAIPVHTVWGERKNFVYGLETIVKNFC